MKAIITNQARTIIHIPAVSQVSQDRQYLMQVQNAWPKFERLGWLHRPGIANHQQQFQDNKWDQDAEEEKEEEDSTYDHDVSGEDADNEEEENHDNVDDGTKRETRNNSSHIMCNMS